MVEMGKWPALAALDIIGSLGLGYGFRGRKSASISGSNNTEENFGPELADSYNTIIDMEIH